MVSGKLEIVVVNTFFVFALFPFVSPVPVNSDVQPIAGSIALLYFLLRSALTGKVPAGLLVGIVFCCFAFIYINPLENVDLQIGKLIALPLALCTALFIYHFRKSFSARVFNAAIFIYFLFSLMFVIFPSQMISIQSLLVRNINVTELGYRGISTFSTEPGLFGGLLVGLLAINIYFLKLKKIKIGMFIVNTIFIVIMIAMTKSGSGYAYLLIFIVLLILKNVGVVKFIASFVVLIAVLTTTSLNQPDMEFDEVGRGAHTIIRLFAQPELFIQDRSILYRIYAVYVAGISFSQSPAGVGHGEVKSISQEIVDNDSYLRYFYGSYGENFHPVSSFGFYLTAYGIWFLTPLFLLFIIKRPILPFAALMISFLLFSYSIAFPITWFLFAMGVQLNNKKSEYYVRN
ncbi:hypothetical protein [Pleionea sediminis]|uniref:hypothetical protein n=1 Tax=Pleionea sediminis TaxID=2569479 RepID=UPI001185FD6D|nr:hypothetical protein [Pleionea sediminis]